MPIDIDLTGASANQTDGVAQNTVDNNDNSNSNESQNNNQNQNNNGNGTDNHEEPSNGGIDANGTGENSSEGNGSTVEDSEVNLSPGDTIELGDDKYTVDGSGNLIDAKGQVFKQKDEISSWIKQFNRVDPNKPNTVEKSNEQGNKNGTQSHLDLATIQNLVGVDVVDDNDNLVEFTDDEDGIKSYLQAVATKQTSEAAQGAVNKFLSNNPQVQDFINYLIVNGGNPYGYGNIVDSSQIKIDKDNPSQQEAIIRHAAKVFNNPMVNDSYIKYLKDTGGLLQEAKTSLDNLVKNEQAYHQQLQQQAAQRQQAEAQAVENYWNNVGNVINSGVIGDFKLPEAFTKEVNGRKMTYNRADFFDYLSRASVKDEQGNAYTQYQADLANQSDEDVLNRELLDAWLMFTGGTLKDLANILIKGNEVKNIRLQAKDVNAHKTIVLNQKQNGYSAEDIAFS